MEGLICIVGGGLFIGAIVCLAMQLGTSWKIKCNRCGYIGKPGVTMVPFQGPKKVCPKCKGDNWERIE